MSTEAWTGLPGPARFIRRIAEDVEDGRSVIVALPKCASDGRWAQRLQRQRIVRPQEVMPVEDIRTCPRPLEVVQRHLLPPEPELYGASVSATCDAVARVFDAAARDGSHAGAMRSVLECPAGWPAWKQWAEFLIEWAKASRNKPVSSRIVFVAVVGGIPLQKLPVEQDSLRLRVWDAVSDEADMLTYAHLAFADWAAPPLHRRVAAAVAASLAIWDPEVVDALAAARLDDVLKPQPLLRRLGQDRGWTHSELRHGITWEDGQRGSIGGAKKAHSAALSLMGDDATVASRVWGGQVGVLLPFVEERRLEIIEAVRPHLRLPWKTRYADIADVRDLEISHLSEQVDMFRLPLAPALREALPVLRHIRNKLAHLEVVDQDTLCDERLLRIQHGESDSASFNSAVISSRAVSMPSDVPLLQAYDGSKSMNLR